MGALRQHLEVAEQCLGSHGFEGRGGVGWRWSQGATQGRGPGRGLGWEARQVGLPMWLWVPLWGLHPLGVRAG